MILTSFDFWVNLRLTKGILVNLTWNGTLSASMPEWVVPRQLRCFCSPLEKSQYFWDFGVQQANQGWTKYGIYSHQRHKDSIRELVHSVRSYCVFSALGFCNQMLPNLQCALKWRTLQPTTINQLLGVNHVLGSMQRKKFL